VLGCELSSDLGSPCVTCLQFARNATTYDGGKLLPSTWSSSSYQCFSTSVSQFACSLRILKSAQLLTKLSQPIDVDEEP